MKEYYEIDVNYADVVIKGGYFPDQSYIKCLPEQDENGNITYNGLYKPIVEKSQYFFGKPHFYDVITGIEFFPDKKFAPYMLEGANRSRLPKPMSFFDSKLISHYEVARILHFFEDEKVVAKYLSELEMLENAKHVLAENAVKREREMELKRLNSMREADNYINSFKKIKR